MADTKMIQGGSANQALAMVSADQETVLGNGTSGRPLRLGAALSFGFTADYVLDGDARVPVPGLPVVVDAAPPSFGIASVTSGSSGTGGQADVVAVVTRVVEGGVVLRRLPRGVPGQQYGRGESFVRSWSWCSSR